MVAQPSQAAPNLYTIVHNTSCSNQDFRKYQFIGNSPRHWYMFLCMANGGFFYFCDCRKNGNFDLLVIQSSFLQLSSV